MTSRYSIPREAKLNPLRLETNHAEARRCDRTGRDRSGGWTHEDVLAVLDYTEE